MLTNARRSRIMRRVTVLASALIFSETCLTLEAAPPTPSPQAAAVPGEMLLAGTGFRGRSRSSLFSSRGKLPRENGEDFLDPDFKDYVGPAGRTNSSVRQKTNVATAPKSEVKSDAGPLSIPDPDELLALPEPSAAGKDSEPAGLDVTLDLEAMAEVDAPPALPPADLDAASEFNPLADVPAVPELELTANDDYTPQTLPIEELFPADVIRSERPQAKQPKEQAGGLASILDRIRGKEAPVEEPEAEMLDDQQVVVKTFPDNEEWPTELYPIPEANYFDETLEEALVAHEQVDPSSAIETSDLTTDSLLALPIPGLDGEDESLGIPVASDDGTADLIGRANLEPAGVLAEPESYWQPPKQQAVAVAAPTQEIAADQQDAGWRTPASVSDPEPAGVASTNDWNGWKARTPSVQTAALPPAPPAVPAETQLAAAPHAGLYVPPAVDAVTEPAVDEAPASTIEEPASAPEDPTIALGNREGLTGLKGFCPVTLCEHRDLIDSDPRFAAVYNDQTYYLASYDALVQFQDDPAKYAPVSGGLDVVALQRDGVEVDGILDHAAWYRGNLYLFATAELLAEFSANPRSYSVK